MKRHKAGGEFFPLLSPGFGSTYCKIPKSQCFNYKHWAFSLLGHKLQPTGTTHQTQQQPHNQPINPLKTQPNSKPITTTNGKTCTNPTTNGHNHTTPKPPIELNQEREMWTQPRERERERWANCWGSFFFLKRDPLNSINGTGVCITKMALNSVLNFWKLQNVVLILIFLGDGFRRLRIKMKPYKHWGGGAHSKQEMKTENEVFSVKPKKLQLSKYWLLIN